VNYASEINGKLEADIFKRMVSGEVIPARLPYGNPMQLEQYAKLIFNCNELPKDVEHTNAYFRRFLIIPFNITIPEKEQDKNLHNKIIDKELSGVFNWVLDGLNRLLKNRRFSECEAARVALEQYKTESNSIKLFLDEAGYQSDPAGREQIKDLYWAYKTFCIDDGMRPFNKRNFIKQLKAMDYVVDRGTGGYQTAYISRR
jgi:putative DNA primase/helicase